MADTRFPDDYKALVVVMLAGGSDSFNMVAPSDSAYTDYATARGSLALSQATLLALNNANENGLNSGTFGMRDNMPDMQTMFNDGELAIMANVGVLKEPTLKADIESGSADLPLQLFSHNSQQALWMAGNSVQMNNGWGARTANEFYPIPNPYINVSFGGDNLMQSGGIAKGLYLDSAYISPNTMSNYGFGPDSGGSTLGAIYEAIYNDALSDANKLVEAVSDQRVDEMDQQVLLQDLYDTKTEFTFGNGVHEIGTPLGNQLEYVAETISVRAAFPESRNRQIFFVKHNGWDSHNSDPEHNINYLSESLGEFNAAMKTLGLHDSVTTITFSDFGRSLTSNGSGTDHGWGGHAYIMGGKVKGGNIFGKMPILANGSIDNYGGRIIPTTSHEQYIATALRWMGATDTELNTIFPNLSAFPTSDMGFMEIGDIPVITLLGNATETVDQDATYTDAGATASDTEDGNITGSIVTNNPVDTSTVGNYTVTYNVTDSDGNVAVEVTRSVEVVTTAVTNHIINGDFSDGTIDNITSTEATIVYDNGRLKVTGVSATYPKAQVSNAYFTGLEIGKTYRLSSSFDNTGSGDSRGRIRIYSSGGNTQYVFNATGNGETGDWVCDDTTPLVTVSLYESTVAGVSVWFDDLVLYEV